MKKTNKFVHMQFSKWGSMNEKYIIILNEDDAFDSFGADKIRSDIISWLGKVRMEGNGKLEVLGFYEKTCSYGVFIEALIWETKNLKINHISDISDFIDYIQSMLGTNHCYISYAFVLYSEMLSILGITLENIRVEYLLQCIRNYNDIKLEKLGSKPCPIIPE